MRPYEAISVSIILSIFSSKFFYYHDAPCIEFLYKLCPKGFSLAGRGLHDGAVL